jgi:hypothetical protein
MNGRIFDNFETFRFLRYVDISKNSYTGTLPSSLFDIPRIEILYFSENAFTGTLPANYANASSLRDLYVDNNFLSGTVPSIQPGQFLNLTEFILEKNNIIGTMPASICALTGESTNGTLTALLADCGGNTPQITCECCTACALDPTT